MLNEAGISPSDLGALAEIIPGREPELRLTIPRIPVTEPGLGTSIYMDAPYPWGYTFLMASRKRL